MEVLSNPESRRQFDSVDEGVQDADTPDPKSKIDFFVQYGPIFEKEGRFSKSAEKAPQLGGAEASKESVNGFYDYYYNFDSWRSFEYLDKEANEGSDSRDEKRRFLLFFDCFPVLEELLTL